MNKEEFIKSIGRDDALLREKIERLDFLCNLDSRTAIHAYEYLDELDILPTAEEYLTYVKDYLLPAILESAKES